MEARWCAEAAKCVPPLEIIDRAMSLIFVGPRHVKYTTNTNQATSLFDEHPELCMKTV